MEKKFKVDSGNEVVPKVELSGLDEIFAFAVDSERAIGKYERFAEHVTLSCAMPEIPRFALEDSEIMDTPMEDAYVALMKLLVRYRRITSWMRSNGIDVEEVAGGEKETVKKMN